MLSRRLLLLCSPAHDEQKLLPHSWNPKGLCIGRVPILAPTMAAHAIVAIRYPQRSNLLCMMKDGWQVSTRDILCRSL